MKILISHRFIWPDNANCGQLVWEIAKHFQSEGHEVDILSSLPSRNISSEKLNKKKFQIISKIKIRRMNLPIETNKPLQRIYNAIKIGLMVLLSTSKKKYDIILMTSVPPILGGLFAALSSKLFKIKFIYFCMDLYPEVGKFSKDFNNFFFYKLLSVIENWSCKQANSIIVHSKDMKRTLLNRLEGKKYNIELINNFSVSSSLEFKSFNRKFNLSKKKLNIIFIGNHGRFQELEKVIRAMSVIKKRKDIQLYMIGDGIKKKRLIYLAEKLKANVKFFPYLPVDVLKKIMKKADIGLVTLRPNMYKYAYPGKLMTYLECGVPIISNIDKKSEFIKNMKLFNYGFHVSIKNIKNLSDKLVYLSDNFSWKRKMQKNARNAYKRCFSQKIILYKWSKILNKNNL